MSLNECFIFDKSSSLFSLCVATITALVCPFILLKSFDSLRSSVSAERLIQSDFYNRSIFSILSSKSKLSLSSENETTFAIVNKFNIINLKT